MPDLGPSPYRSPQFRGTEKFEYFVIGAIVVAALYIGRDIFMPIAIAILLSFALNPLVGQIERLRIGRVASIAVVVLLSLGAVAGGSAFIGRQLSQLAQDLPNYQDNITAKIRAVRGTANGLGLFGRASGFIQQLNTEISQPDPNGPKPPAPTVKKSSRPASPVPVEIQEVPATPLELAKFILAPLLQPLATAAVVTIFVVFFLLQQDDIRSRFIRLLGTSDIQRTALGLDDAGRRLSRYLLVQAAVNTAFGVLVALGLFFIGIPNPVLWGIAGMMLRFVPYLGPIIAALLPACVALAVDPGWTMVAWTAALFLVVEPVIGQGVEPFLYGHTTGLSPLAVIIAITFWTWLWGPVGLLLSTPLTLCLVVVGRYAERFEFLNILLGDQPPLTPDQSFYYYLLAGNSSGIAAQRRECLDNATAAEYYDSVVIKGLSLAQADFNRGRLDSDRRDEMRELLLELAEAFQIDAPSLEIEEAEASVLCLSGRSPFDEIASALLAHALHEKGIATRILPNSDMSTNKIDSLELSRIRIVCISYLQSEGYAHARLLVNRLQRRLPTVKIILGFWGMDPTAAFHSGAREEMGVEALATTFKHAAESIASALNGATQERGHSIK